MLAVVFEAQHPLALAVNIEPVARLHFKVGRVLAQRLKLDTLVVLAGECFAFAVLGGAELRLKPLIFFFAEPRSLRLADRMRLPRIDRASGSPIGNNAW